MYLKIKNIELKTFKGFFCNISSGKSMKRRTFYVNNKTLKSYKLFLRNLTTTAIERVIL